MSFILIPDMNVFKLQYLHVKKKCSSVVGNHVAVVNCPKLTLVQQVEMCCRCEEISKNALKNTKDRIVNFDPSSAGLLNSLLLQYFYGLPHICIGNRMLLSAIWGQLHEERAKVIARM